MLSKEVSSTILKVFGINTLPTRAMSLLVREAWVQSQVASYQRLLKWYLIPPCLTLSNIKYVSRVKWSNPGKGVVLFPTPRCYSYWKGSLLVALDYGRQLYYFFLPIVKYQNSFVLFEPLIGPYQVLQLRARVDPGVVAIKDTQHSPKLPYYWSLTIRLLSVISRNTCWGVLPLCREAVGVILHRKYCS